IPQAAIDAERETQEAILAKESEGKPAKPQNVVDKILEGRMKKFFEESCLLTQAFIKDQDSTVGAYLNSLGKNLKVEGFVRFEKGEGIVKKEEDFAAEVAAMGG
ncbi:MAG: elongation factor Ts, partial [Oscillospiraceae bacterium]|nr:elongation factor Ts [Oscillospiraceae bacterium]